MLVNSLRVVVCLVSGRLETAQSFAHIKKQPDIKIFFVKRFILHFDFFVFFVLFAQENTHTNTQNKRLRKIACHRCDYKLWLSLPSLIISVILIETI